MDCGRGGAQNVERGRRIGERRGTVFSCSIVVAERETAALFDWLRQPDRRLVSSDLTRTQLMRAIVRASPDRAPSVRDVLAQIALVTLDAADFDAAGRLSPPGGFDRSMPSIWLSRCRSVRSLIPS